MTFVPLITARPLPPMTATMVSGSPFGSESLASTGIVTATCRVVVAVSSRAMGGRLLTIVVTGGVRLFVGFGSDVGLSTLATFVTVPRMGAVTVSVKFVLVAG